MIVLPCAAVTMLTLLVVTMPPRGVPTSSAIQSVAPVSAPQRTRNVHFSDHLPQPHGKGQLSRYLPAPAVSQSAFSRRQRRVALRWAESPDTVASATVLRREHPAR